MNTNIKCGIFPLVVGNLKLFATVLVLMMAFLPSASGCTITCYVDDDGTGDYNVDHNEDEIQIQQAIDAVHANASSGNWGTVILNKTTTPYEIRNEVNLYSYVTLMGETSVPFENGNQRVTMRLSANAPNDGYAPGFIEIVEDNVNVMNLHLDGNVTANRGSNGFWEGLTNGRGNEAIYMMGSPPYRSNVLIQNISAYDTTVDVIYGAMVSNVTVRNIRGTHIGHTVVDIRSFSPNSNLMIEDIYCHDLVNACVRFRAMDGATVRNVYVSYPEINNGNRNVGYYTQFGIEMFSDNSYPIQNIYFENFTIIQPGLNGIIMYQDSSITTASRFRNITFKNFLIDCSPHPYQSNICKYNNGGEPSDAPQWDREGAVRIQSAESVVLDGFTIVNGMYGVRIANYLSSIISNITIKNSIIINNSRYGITTVRGNSNYAWHIDYNDLWNNGYGAIGGFAVLGTGNINGVYGVNPLFANSPSGSSEVHDNIMISNLRLKSQYSRWTGSVWTTDTVTSPAIDAGDPSSDYSKEPTGNGGRINLGFDGNTLYTSKSSNGKYSISGYVFDNNNALVSSAIVTDGVNSSNTDTYGFYTISGLNNGTYNLSYSKAGFNTGYLNIIINGKSNSTANKTIYDTTAPSVSGLTATKTNSTTVTLSYDATGSWYKIYRDGSLRTTTQSNSWIDTTVSVGNTYQYTVSAIDTYGNQGSNSSVNITVYSYTITNLTPSIDTAIKSGQPGLSRGLNTWIDLGKLSGSTNGNYRGLLNFDISTIPTSAKINSAILTLTWEGGNRNQTTVINVFRPSSLWDAQYASWNNRQNSISWTTQGGDWIDRNGVSYGSLPYAEITYPAGSTADAKFNVALIIQDYVNGNYPNTGFFLKANELENTYISFYSSEASNANQRPKLTINYTESGDIPSNPAPSITAFFPSGLTPQYPVNTSASFNVSVDQQVTNKWFFDNILQSETSGSFTKTWSFVDAGTHNLTYSGENANGTVTSTWIVKVQNVITVPSAPQNLVAIPGHNQIDLSWQTPSSNGGAAITNYNIYRYGYLVATPGNILTYTDSNLTSGVEYSYQVSAINSAGESAKSSQFNIIPSLNTVVSLTAISDTSIKSGQPNSMRGPSAWIDLGRLSGTTYGNYRGLVYFNVSTIPPLAKINSAILTLTWEGGNRNQTTLISVYRPSSLWDAQYASWNTRQNSVSWTTQGGDWIDRDGVSYGSLPYAEITYPAGSTADANLDVTSIIKEYVNENYSNTGFFLKANELEDTYISFHSSEASNASQRPKLTISYTTVDTQSNPAPSINTFSPSNLTPQYPVNTSASFSVTTNQSVSNTWFSDGIKQNTSTQAWFNRWNLPGQHNVTYVGSNSNGSVSMTWNVSVIPNHDIIPNASVNLIKNGGSESGKDYWMFYTNGAGTFSIVSPGYGGNNASRLVFSKGGSNIQLYQTAVALQANTRYRLSFAAYSNTGHDMTVRLLKHVSPYTLYMPDFNVNLTTKWQTFTTEFNSTSFTGTVSDGRLMFWLAPFVKAGDVYYIDNIILEKI